uniref:Uncharacterized protein n=1 Tax=Angiostrongylus cantonensis TaxID=6313 RepID=A0A0K0CWD5_ANGCA
MNVKTLQVKHFFPSAGLLVTNVPVSNECTAVIKCNNAKPCWTTIVRTPETKNVANDRGETEHSENTDSLKNEKQNDC